MCGAWMGGPRRTPRTSACSTSAAPMTWLQGVRKRRPALVQETPHNTCSLLVKKAF